MDSVYVVTIYEELAGVYSTKEKAEARIREIERYWGDPPTVTWVYVAIDQDIATLYDRKEGER